MKNNNRFGRCVAAVIAIILVGNAAAQQDALVAHYPFDRDANDQTGNIEPIDGVAIKEILQGKHGGALYFDGATVVEIPIDLSADILPEFTVSMWVKADRPPTDPQQRKNLTTSMVVASNLLNVANRTSDTPSFYVMVPGAKGTASQHRVRPGQWAHVVITRKIEDRANRKGDVVPHIISQLHSGGRMTEKVAPFGGSQHEPSIYLGGSSMKGGKNNFVGFIDDLKIYRTAMGVEQIAALKTTGGSPRVPDGESAPNSVEDAPTNTNYNSPIPADVIDRPESASDVVNDNSQDAHGDQVAADEPPDGTATIDWSLAAVRLADSAQEDNLFSGKTVRLIATVGRDDGNNQQPSALLTLTATNPADPGWVDVQTVYANQSSDRENTRNYPIAIEIPVLTRAGRPLGPSNLVLTAKLGFPEGSTTVDSRPENNVIQSTIVVNKVPANSEHEISDYRVDLSNPVTTAVSGTPAPNNTDVVISGQGKQGFIRGLRLTLQSQIKKICGGELSYRFSGAPDLEFGSKRCGSFRSLGLIVQSVSNEHVLTGLGICQATSDNRVLGIRAEWRRILTDGTFGFDTHFSESDEIGLCNNWVEFVRCPVGMAAGGLAASYDSGGGTADKNKTYRSDYIKGLALICGRVVVKDEA